MARRSIIEEYILVMSPEAVNAERILHELRHLLRHGKLGIGVPLTVQALADDFGVSITPVRDALNRLVGERLVELQPGGGFAVPGVTREGAASLYAWHADIVGAILRIVPDPEILGPVPAAIRSAPADATLVAALTVDLFDRLASSSVNPERRRALDLVAQRLHVLRLHEAHLLRHGAELRGLWEVLLTGNKRAIRIAVGRYHGRRLARAEQIAQATMGSIRGQKPSPTR